MSYTVLQMMSLAIAILIVIIMSHERNWIFVESEFSYPIYIWAFHAFIFYSMNTLDTYIDTGINYHNWSIILRLSLAISIVIPLIRLVYNNQRR